MTRASDKWALFFDADKCNACNNCAMAVADEYHGNAFPGYSPPLPRDTSWFRIEAMERGGGTSVDVTYYLRTCQHCQDAPCSKVGPPGAVRIRPDGIVMVDPVRAKGAREIVDACPHGAMVWNEEHQVPQNWNFDAHLLDDGWNVPRPVQACPTGALSFARLSDADFEAAKADAGPNPFKAGNGRVVYRGTEALANVFVAGRLVEQTASGDFECVPGCQVTLEDSSGARWQHQTDAFGHFRIDGIPRAELPGELELVVASASRRIRLTVTDSLDLGRIVLNVDPH